jgi:hypothetical protein
MKKPFIILCLLAAVLLAACTIRDKENYQDLAANFVNPPDDARIWVYWFWLNSNITREGITADLEAMKRVGVGGVLIMEVDQGAPLGPVAFMSDQWRELFRHMVSEASRLGIEVNMNNDAGWNGSGGPWVPLDKSMQTVVISESRVAAGSAFRNTLPRPKANSGFYRDITVLAFPTPEDDGNPSSRIIDLGSKSFSTPGAVPGSIKKEKYTDVTERSVVHRDMIIDLSSKMDSAGLLTWEAPLITGTGKGTWTVVRFGHTFTGAENAPSPLSGRGPECDKLSREGIEVHYNGMMHKLVQDVGQLAGKTLVSTHVDSWEVGPQNWTPKMREEFRRLRGYDMTPYLPVLTGRIVENREISERFLRDLRQTVSDLLAVNYIGHLRELAHKDGLRLSMEAYSTPANDLDVGNHVDEPISEFWNPEGGGFWWSQKSMASLSHVNGLKITGAEAFTSAGDERWLAHPATIKALGDKAFCAGVNRFIVHRYAMQPWVEERRPGMTMGPWGLHYERTQTWWEDSKAWHQYVARCQYMLRQGNFVADVLCLNSEEPVSRFRQLKLEGNDYDGISPQKFLKDVTVQDGMLLLPSGMKYRLLVLLDDVEMSPAMLKKIKELVEAGATITGEAPVKAPGLTGYPESDEEIKKIAAGLWGNGNSNDRKVGMGRVISGKTPQETLEIIGISKDFTSSQPMNYIHRSVGDEEVYFIAGEDINPSEVVCSFRITGMNPESWDPQTGRMVPIHVYREEGDRTFIALNLDRSGSRFIVFRHGLHQDINKIVSVKNGNKELVNLSIPEEKEKELIKYAATKSNFTIAAWVKPDAEITLLKEADSGVNGFQGARNDVVFAAPAHSVMTDQDAGAGFGVGTNGVGVIEHSANYFSNILVYAVPINGWTHIAVVYENNTPGLWINGKFVHRGLKSSKTVHGSLGLVHEKQVNTFTGQVANLMQYPKTLSSKEIMDLVRSMPDTLPLKPAEPVLDPVALEISAAGVYSVTSASGKRREITLNDIPEKLEIRGSWEVDFTPGWGAPGKVTFDKLISWSHHPDPGVRYFSGSATYRHSFSYHPPAESDKSLKPVIYLDLGKVAVMARVILNGKDLGILWRPPYQADITGAVAEGKNELEIRVVNLWINRMIGDEQLPEDSKRNPDGTLREWPQWILDGKPDPAGRFTFTTWRLWDKDSPLQSSGLLGPVSIRTVYRFDPGSGQ